MVSDHPRLTVVRTYKNKLMDYVTTRLRSSHGADVIGHREAAFPVLRALRKNGYAAFLADHNTSRSEAFFLPFLGEEAAVNKGPAVLAVRAKALVWAHRVDPRRGSVSYYYRGAAGHGPP